ncbi:hypothetical protein RZR97_08415 [Hydrogenimonas thermophila]|uniref:hypothetical protein n=1 Tax=Hydrogenimonas thermophila TaxID=223786 RepID=UPI00293706F3|nr:hypothetical protein [Hydrogenimonas thermophila]WOE69131.1 hypothetical protein RZR91_08440 [Hydrogenimonas thermophila]WOE71641.1 hypothetical protein RZR97_08415 [Hydrogenimonas thermophila]
MAEKMIELEVKVTMEEMKKIGEFCRQEGVNFSEWMRKLALKEIENREKEKRDSKS